MTAAFRALVALALVAVLALAVARPSTAAVRQVALTAKVKTSDRASLTVSVSPRARCTIKVVYDTTVSRAEGLGAKTGTKITWSWRVGSTTNSGRWPITVSCGKSGSLKTSFRVVRR